MAALGRRRTGGIGTADCSQRKRWGEVGLISQWLRGWACAVLSVRVSASTYRAFAKAGNSVWPNQGRKTLAKAPTASAYPALGGSLGI
eukprot:1630065-Alexandrium_andersonii.AAC.1